MILVDSCLISGVMPCLRGFPGGSDSKESACKSGDLEMGVGAHSGILAWGILRTEEPGGLWSMGLPRVGHNWVTNRVQKFG